ncbi:hypothetical protein F5884DRAFT_854740 [Xylogone sp. PMI_703]|nr:hypothetical protein F5884DRAFT_854740 [Xylogone sp. PMI_703]
MAYQDHSGGYPPPRDSRDYVESQYPPPPGEEDDRARAYHQRIPSAPGSVTLPSISPYMPNGGYAPDPRGYQQPPYREPPQGAYRDDRPYPQEYGRGAPQHMAFSQSAPRQRTAIACRYCRRRKIRCSGFDQNPEGRCSNCQRFQQECIFTPVSSQAQAFVPAHAVYPNMRNMGVGPDGRPRPMAYQQPTQLFGAHGQPLGPVPPQAAASPYSDYPMPSPTSSYGSFDDRSVDRKRPQQDPHPSILPPPIPGQPGYQRADSAPRRTAVEDDLRLPPVTPTSGAGGSNYSPGSSTSSITNLQPPSQPGLPSMSRTPPPRSSPGDRSDPMSLGSIMERRPDTEIDRSMLGRLDRKS